MLADDCEKLVRRAPAGFSPTLLAGIDAGLAVRADDRPQSIADWRSILGRPGASDAATMAMRRPPSAAAKKRSLALWIGGAAAAIVAAGAALHFAEPNLFAPHVAAPTISPDGRWRGAMHCSGNAAASEFTIILDMEIAGGIGKWVKPGAAKTRNRSLTLSIKGAGVAVSREFEPFNFPGKMQVATMSAHYEGARIKGSGSETNSGGRTCDIDLIRAN